MDISNQISAAICDPLGRICSVTFTKKDGTERRMRVQPAALKFLVKSDHASQAGRKAAETRAARHPNLLPVYDVEAQAIRSINLNSATRAAACGQVHTF